MPSETTGHSEGALAPYIRAARLHPWLIAAVVVVALVAGIAWAATRGRDYEASAQVLVTPLASAGSFTGLPILTDSVDPTRTQETAASMLQSTAAAATAARAVPGWTPQRVDSAVTVQPRGESNIVTVTATAPTASVATTLANAYTRGGLTARSQTLQSEVANTLTSLRAQRKTLGSGDTASLAAIDGEISDLQRIADGQDPNFSLLQAASTATPTGTPTSLIAILALLGGLVLGVGAAVLLEHLNRRVRDEDEFLAQYPLPVLTRVPVLPRGSEDLLSPDVVPPRVHEAFRTLGVLLERPDAAARTILVTSASKGDGKTTAAIQLAIALSAASDRVVLMDFDLRKPEINSRLGTDSDVTQLFRQGVRLRDVLSPAPTHPGVQVLGSSTHENVVPVLEALTRRIPELVDEAQQTVDYLVIDTPPLGEVSDALRAAAAVDDIVLVARPGNTDRGDLQRTRELLEAMGHTPAGVIVVGEDVPRRDAYGYGYGTDATPRPASEVPLIEPLEPVGEAPSRRRAGS